MKRIFILLLTLALSLPGMAQLDRSVKPSPAPARELKMGTYKMYTLKNGLKVLVVEDHKLPRVSFNLVLDVNGTLEGDKAGVGNMAGSLMSSGTTTRTKAQIDEEVDFIGASLSTSGTGAYASALSKYQEQILALMADVVLNPTFPQEEFDKVKKQTLSGIKSGKDDPGALMDNLSTRLLFGKDHPFGEVETEATVENITPDDCKAHYSNFFRPNIAYIAVVGDIKPSKAKKLVEKYFGAWSAAQVNLPEVKFPEVPAQRNVAFLNRDASVQSNVTISNVIALPKGSPDEIKMAVANQILGGGMSGRLFKNLREDKAYTYGAYSYYQTNKVVSAFGMSATVRNEVTDSAITEFMNELQKMRTAPVTDEEMAQAKALLIGNFGRSLESPQTLATFALNVERYGLPKDYYQNYVKSIEAVTKEDIMAVAQKYMLADQTTIFVVGKGTEVAEKLVPFGPIQFYDADGNITDAPGIPVPAGSTVQTVLDAYINASGGRKALEGLKTLTIKSEATIQGFSLKLTESYKAPDKYLLVQDLGPMGKVEIKVNGSKVKILQNGSPMPVDDAQAAEMATKSTYFPELKWPAPGVELSLKGMVKIDGKLAYEMAIAQGGKTSFAYFDQATGLKVRESETVEGPEGPIVQNVDMSDFQTVKGITVPFMKRMPLGPMTAEFKTTAVEVNPKLADTLFQ
jgi:predicted Zn-dependent peptidase